MRVPVGQGSAQARDQHGAGDRSPKGLAELAAGGGEDFGAVMQWGMDDQEGACAVGGGELGFAGEGGVLGPAIAGEAAFAIGIGGFEAKGDA